MLNLRREHPDWPDRWISGTVASELEKQKVNALTNRTDFAFETKFSSEMVAKMVNVFKDAGFKVTLCYFGLLSEDESVSRVKLRAQTATLCWIDVEPQKEGITEGEDAVAEIKAMPVLIQRDGGKLIINGAKAGTPISVYDLSGKLIGKTTATKGATRVQVATSEKVVIVKVGERSVKVAR